MTDRIDSILDTKLDRAFALLDTDRNGKLEKSDFLVLADRLGTVFSAEAETRDLMRDRLAELWDVDVAHMDTDGDGCVDRDEFRAGARKSVAVDRHGLVQRLGAMMAVWMRMADADGDGVVNLQEYITMFSVAMPGTAPENLEVAFHQLDADGDGVLNNAEVSQAVQEYYTSEDPNSRGNMLYGPL